MKESQTNRILRYMLKHGGITSLRAIRMFGCTRLSGRIFEIKQAGVDISEKWVHRNGKKFKEYSLKTLTQTA